MIVIVEFISITIALFLISLSIKKHKKQFVKNKDDRVITIIVTFGWILLLLTSVEFAYRYDIGIGLTYWFGAVGICSFILAVIYGRIKSKK